MALGCQGTRGEGVERKRLCGARGMPHSAGRPWEVRQHECPSLSPEELELELMQSHMAQMPVLRGEMEARALRVWLVPREGAWASAGVHHIRPEKLDSGSFTCCGSAWSGM